MSSIRTDLAACLLSLAETGDYPPATIGVATTTDNPSMLDLPRTEALGKS